MIVLVAIVVFVAVRWALRRARDRAYHEGQLDAALDFAAGYSAALCDVIGTLEAEGAEVSITVPAARHDTQVQAAREGRQ